MRQHPLMVRKLMLVRHPCPARHSHHRHVLPETSPWPCSSNSTYSAWAIACLPPPVLLVPKSTNNLQFRLHSSTQTQECLHSYSGMDDPRHLKLNLTAHQSISCSPRISQPSSSCLVRANGLREGIRHHISGLKHFRARTQPSGSVPVPAWTRVPT